MKRDLALLVDKSVNFAQLRRIAFRDREKTIEERIAVRTYTRANKLPEGKKSYALSFVLEDREKTLTDQVIDRTMGNLIREFERQASERRSAKRTKNTSNRICRKKS